MVCYSVYPIVNGCSIASVFSGSLSDCQDFVHFKRIIDPDFDFILLEDY